MKSVRLPKRACGRRASGLRHLHALMFPALVVGSFLLAGTELSGQTYKLNADYLRFFDKNGTAYVELSYAFDGNALQESIDSTGAKSRLGVVRVEIRKAGVPVHSDGWKVGFDKGDDRIVDFVRFSLRAGEYRVALRLDDPNRPGVTDSVGIDLRIDPFPKNDIALSDLELASSITRADTAGSFVKNGYAVVPNPGRLYGEGRPILYYYIETYNMNKGLAGSDYTVEAAVLTIDERPLEALAPESRQRSNGIDATVEVGTFNISSLRTGEYLLRVRVLESDTLLLASRSQKFFVYHASNRDVPALVESVGDKMLPDDIHSTMTENELDYEYELINYLLNDSGKKFYLALTSPEAKRKFIRSFWISRDQATAVAPGTARGAYFSRKEFADQKYRRMGKEGWKTDRGRIYMTYGEPDDVDRFPSTSESYPYEIWYYNQFEGGVEFVFVDTGGFNEYILVHSTAVGEVQNADWQIRLARVLR